MEFQIALNTIILLMIAVFPGFLFRKFYFVGEFTKQFRQDTQFDKFIWNIFFSSIAILATIISIYIFKNIFKLELLESISYDSLSKLIKPIQQNAIPEKDSLYRMYKDIIILISLIYFFASFLGLISYWVVRTFSLDTTLPIFRFNNHWYYYIHGGAILYHNKKNRKREFTFADVLCDNSGVTQLYTGILSQYIINKETNDLECIFLTNASRYKLTKNPDGSTKEVSVKEIAGDTFCVPYNRVLNMNLTYYYKPSDNSWKLKIWRNLIRILFLVAIIGVGVSMFFDLSAYSIIGFFDKSAYLLFSFIGLSSFKLILDTMLQLIVKTESNDVSAKLKHLPMSIGNILISMNWLCYIMIERGILLHILLTIAIILIASLISDFVGPKDQDFDQDQDDDEGLAE